MTAPTLHDAFHGACLANVAASVRQLARVEVEDPEVAGLVIQWFADGTLEVQLLNGQSMPIGGYSL